MGGHSLAMALRRAYLSMHRTTEAICAEFGVSADQFVLLCALASGKAMKQQELAARTASDANTVRAMLVLLERKGLIERRPNPVDGRARMVVLTRVGQQTHAALWKKTRGLRRRLVGAVERELTESFTQKLVRIERTLDPRKLSVQPADPHKPTTKQR